MIRYRKLLKAQSCGFHSRAVRVAGLLLTCTAIAISFASPADADMIYAYTGPSFGTCFGTYSTDGATYPTSGPCNSYAVTGDFDTTLSLSALESMTDYEIPDADIKSFSFTDGNFTLNQSNAPEAIFDISTNSSGDITNWLVSLASQTLNLNSPTNVVDLIVTDKGVDESANPGNVACSGGACVVNQVTNGGNSRIKGTDTLTGVQTWSAPVSTPEPSSLWLVFSIGLVGMGARLFRRRTPTRSAAR
jgi:PEP-CTERM motif